MLALRVPLVASSIVLIALIACDAPPAQAPTPGGPGAANGPQKLRSVTQDSPDLWGKTIPHRVLDECDASAELEDWQNYGKFAPSAGEVKQVLDMLDGICTDQELEHKAALDCIAAKHAPFFRATFKLPAPSTDKNVSTTCGLWMKTAVLNDWRWVVIDAHISPESGAEVRHRYVLELKPGGPKFYTFMTDAGGPQMMSCQAPGEVDNFHKEEGLPNDLRNFFLCDSWR